MIGICLESNVIIIQSDQVFLKIESPTQTSHVQNGSLDLSCTSTNFINFFFLEYEAKAQDFGNKKIINVATGEQESYISPWKIIPRRVASFSIVLIFITMSICRALGIVYYRLFLISIFVV